MATKFIVLSDRQSQKKAQRISVKYDIEHVCYDDFINDKISCDTIYIEILANHNGNHKMNLIIYDKKLSKLSTEINFLNIKNNRSGEENLLKAIGKISPENKIYDLTAGFARDAFIIAKNGINITLIERHPIIYEITKNAIQNSSKSLLSKMHLINKDSLNFLEHIVYNKNNIFYLDPMFSEVKKAKVKKEMQILQRINPPEVNLDKLLHKALDKGGKVIVKRPINSKHNYKISPHHTINGSKIKFDIFTMSLHGA